MAESVVRRVRLAPYAQGRGPTFVLTVWDTGRQAAGKWVLGYRLSMGRQVLFTGEDFGCSPQHAIDSDATVGAIMAFLTLQPGDTDREYFDSYTPAQLDYCAQHAEAVASEVERRFGS